MLRKLVKNEWRATWKIVTLMNIFIIAITLLGSAFLYSGLWTFNSENIFAVLCLIFYYLAIAVLSSAVCIYIAYRFYKNLYSDEGYLMHTLPVSAHQLLISKTVIASAQLLLTLMVIMLCIFSLSYSTYHSLETSEMTKISTELYNALLPQMQMFGDKMSFPFSFALYMGLAFLFSSIASVLMSYCAISLGQLFSKHKLMSSILCYFGLYMILQIVTSIGLIPVFAVNSLTDSSFFRILSGTLGITIIISIIFSVLFYVLSYYLMNKKLNLD